MCARRGRGVQYRGFQAADPGGVPFEAGLKETYRWYLRHHKPRTAGFELDDKLLGMARAVSTVSV